MKKQFIIASAAIIALTGFGSVALVSADTNHTKTDQSAKTQRADRHVRMTTRLNQAVRDGTITQAQKTAFETELKTLRKQHQTAINTSSTKAERQAERSKLKTELQSWATSTAFPLAKIFPKLAA